MKLVNHQIDCARQIPSPNFNQRPDPDDISLIVIHCISLPPGQFGGDYIGQLFTNALNPGDDPYFEDIYQLQVSAHLLIRRDGELLQFVAFDRCAWHAGVSNYQGRENCNDFSIGIELEGLDSMPYTDKQYRQLAQVIRLLIANYPKLNKDGITGHSDIAPIRKTDPGPAFDWQYLKTLLG